MTRLRFTKNAATQRPFGCKRLPQRRESVNGRFGARRPQSPVTDPARLADLNGDKALDRFVSKTGFHFVEMHCQNTSGFGSTGLAGHPAMDTKIHSQRATVPIRSENPLP